MDDPVDSRHGYIPGWSAAGFLVYDSASGQQTFEPSWATPDNPSFFPKDCTICASTRGLLLCNHPDATTDGSPAYTVCNPYIPDSTRHIPNPNPLHEGRIPRVLVVYVHPTTRLWVFHIVCASLEGDDSPSYKFDVYSSNTDRWNSGGLHDLGFLREDTGVSCGTKAYWLRRDAPVATYYDTETNSVGNIALPDAYVWLFGQPDSLRSQLGELRNQLCVVVATEKLHAVYTAAGAGGGWVCNHQDLFEDVNFLPVLSRFQDYRLQVPFWFEENNTLTIWNSSWGDYMRRDDLLSDKVEHADVEEDILPLVHTRLHPVRHFPN